MNETSTETTYFVANYSNSTEVKKGTWFESDLFNDDIKIKVNDKIILVPLVMTLLRNIQKDKF